jgi:hypothetical protein
MFSVDILIIFGLSVLLGLMYGWARSRLVELFTYASNFTKHQCIGTFHGRSDRISVSEESFVLEDAFKTAKSDTLDSDGWENVVVRSADRLSCGMLHLGDYPSMNTPPAITPYRGQFQVDLRDRHAQSQSCYTSEGTHSDPIVDAELAVSSIWANPDQRSAAFEAAVDAALERRLGDLEARVEARLQTYLDFRLNNLGGVYVTSAIFEEKLSEFEAVAGNKLTKLSKCQYTLTKELHLVATNDRTLAKELDLVANNVCALAKTIQVVSDCVAQGVESTANFQDKQYEANVQFDTAIQNIFATIQRITTKPSEVPGSSKEDLHGFSAARQRVRAAFVVIASKVQGPLANGPTPDQQALIRRSEHMVETAVRIIEGAHQMNMQVSAARLEVVAEDMEEAAFRLDQ